MRPRIDSNLGQSPFGGSRKGPLGKFFWVSVDYTGKYRRSLFVPEWLFWEQEVGSTTR